MKILHPLEVLLAILFFTANGSAEEPLRVNQIWKGDLELVLPEEGGLTSKPGSIPLIELANIDNSPQDEIIYIHDRRLKSSEGYEGAPNVYTWDGSTFLRPSSGGLWAAQEQDLLWVHLLDEWRITYFSPGNTGLPIRTINILNDPSGPLFLIGFLKSLEINPGGVLKRYRFMAFRLEQDSFIKVAEVSNSIFSFGGYADCLSIVAGDFDGDGIDETAIYAPNGDAGTFWLLKRDIPWRFLKFAEGAHHYLIGAGDVDRDGRVELLAGGNYNYQKHMNPWCFEWRQGTFVFDHSITVPGNDVDGRYLLGNLIGSSMHELLYYRDNSVTVYGFE